jgi:DNA polymerase-3 subunit epsilon
MREVIFDTETTGLDPHNGDRMVEIGCIELIGRIETGRTFHAYFNPEREMPPEAEQVHGLTTAFLATQPTFAERADELLSFLGDAPLVAHNAEFDFAFLNAELERAGRAPIASERMIDTVAIARRKHPSAKLSLDALCARYGIDRSHRVKHGALLDAQLLAQLYVELTGGRQIGLGLVGSEDLAAAASAPAATGALRAVRPLRPPRPHAPSPEELARHRAFIAEIKDAIWTR